MIRRRPFIPLPHPANDVEPDAAALPDPTLAQMVVAWGRLRPAGQRTVFAVALAVLLTTGADAPPPTMDA